MRAIESSEFFVALSRNRTDCYEASHSNFEAHRMSHRRKAAHVLLMVLRQRTGNNFKFIGRVEHTAWLPPYRSLLGSQ